MPTRTPSSRFCGSRLAVYKVPKAVHVVAELPVDAQGKILKRELRKVKRACERPLAQRSAKRGPSASEGLR